MNQKEHAACPNTSIVTAKNCINEFIFGHQSKTSIAEINSINLNPIKL